MEFDIHSYDKYIVSFSGGKDSTATFLYLLDNGIPKDKIELWHQEIDAREQTFFDWEITPDYCRRFAEAFGVKIYFQWKQGGFLRELMRDNSLTAPNFFECEDGTIGKSGGKTGNLTTRHKFPALSSNLKIRWCSSYLKIDVCKAALINQPRFRGIRTLVLSGERAEESPARAKYKVFEPDSADLRHGKEYFRYIDHLRPVLHWTEAEVWAILKRYRVRAHPCYYLGWSRCSCKFCIFGNKDQFASANLISPCQTDRIIRMEKDFKFTMKPGINLLSFLSKGKSYTTMTAQLIELATNYNYDLPVILSPDEEWIMPAGAFGENCGPM